MQDYFSFVFEGINKILSQHSAFFESMGMDIFRSLAVIILAWFGIYPRSEGERTLTASWQENDITTEVTASLGPRGGLSSPGQGQGLQYRRYNQVSAEVQTGVIRADGMVHTTTMPGGDPETVHDKEAAARIYRDLGSAAVHFTVPRSGYEQRTWEE